MFSSRDDLPVDSLPITITLGNAYSDISSADIKFFIKSVNLPYTDLVSCDEILAPLKNTDSFLIMLCLVLAISL
jgi:hypothetical protein